LMKSWNGFNWANDLIRFLPPCLGCHDVKMVNRLNAFICNWFNRVESLLRLPKKAQYFPFRPICPKRLQSIRSTKRSGYSSVSSSLGSNQRRLGSARWPWTFAICDALLKLIAIITASDVNGWKMPVILRDVRAVIKRLEDTRSWM